MKRYTAEKIMQVQEKAIQTLYYRNALSRHKRLEKQLLEVLPTIPKEQQDIRTDYCDSFFEFHLYMLELACE